MSVGAVTYERFTCFYLHSVTDLKGPWCVTVSLISACRGTPPYGGLLNLLISC